MAIFDLDGTILETLEDLADSLNFVLDQYGFPCHSYDEIKYMVGNGVPKLVERAVPGGKNNVEYERILADFIEYYGAHSAVKTRPYDGMLELLGKLKSAGMKLAVNTNKVEPAAVDLCKKFFPGVFDFVSGGKKDFAPKPASDGVRFILGLAGMDFNDESVKKSVVFVGDSDVDIQTGKNAGFDAIGVSWGFRGREFLMNHGAEKIVDDCNALYNEIVK